MDCYAVVDTFTMPLLVTPSSFHSSCHQNTLSRLIILNMHIKSCHSATNTTVIALRHQSNWIPAAHQYVKSILHHCVICHKVSGRPYAAPDPPSLPQL